MLSNLLFSLLVILLIADLILIAVESLLISRNTYKSNKGGWLHDFVVTAVISLILVLLLIGFSVHTLRASGKYRIIDDVVGDHRKGQWKILLMMTMLCLSVPVSLIWAVKNLKKSEDYSHNSHYMKNITWMTGISLTLMVFCIAISSTFLIINSEKKKELNDYMYLNETLDKAKRSSKLRKTK